ncbi:DUF2393 domain-containing protein [Campylobacter sp. RM5004]|uniref:DUF2393 family protein n=1 Tax=Campylobacter sp. RM5004 TaxID=1660078 RepID=UPI001EFB6941|nr:DUF2393 family protein [Campylobacter sp. RM5004]ULO00989.1 DUF2393 domain-containing protein [Campylobacter sp. RM5004]
MQKILDSISFYLANFYAQDLILLGLCFLFFIIILILAIFLRRFPVFSLFLIIFGIIGEFVLFFMGENYINMTYRPAELEFIKNEKLLFSDNIFLDFKLHNKSQKDFKICKIKFSIKKPSKNNFVLIKNTLKPIKTIEIVLKDIPANSYEKSFLIIPSNVKKHTISTFITCF